MAAAAITSSPLLVLAVSGLLLVGTAAGGFAAAGMLDPTFGSGGIVTTSVDGYAFAYTAALQPDGKVVAAGEGGSSSTTTGFALVRYGTDGLLDSTFGTGGRVTTQIGDGFDRAFGLVVQPDETLVVAGTSADGGVGRIGLARYDATGHLDGTFGTGGIVTTLVLANASGFALLRQPDGKLVVVGSATPSPPASGQFASRATRARAPSTRASGAAAS